jgi:uncharacterized protein (DUF736 family)
VNIPEQNKAMLFENTQKKKGSKQPDYKGLMKLGKYVYEVAGWKGFTRNTGSEYLSLAMTKTNYKKIND